MRNLRLAPVALVIALLVTSCWVYQGRYRETGFWRVYASQEDCVKVQAVIGDTDSRRPYYMGWARSYYSYWTPWGNWDCAQQWGRPRGYLAARWESYKWIPGPVGDGWTICRATNGWTYNSEDNIYSQASAAMEPAGVMWPPCGQGWYFVHGCGYTYNGGWHGGCLVTDSLYFPG